jgi:phage terminase small subunit
LLKVAEFAARKDALIATVIERAVDAAVMDLNEVLTELSKLGRSSIKNVIVRGGDTGDVVEALEALPDQHAAAIQELTVETYMEGGGDDAREVKRVKVKLHSKPAALAELRRHFEPLRHEHTGANGGPIETKDTTEPLTELELGRRIAFALEKAARIAAAAKPAAKKKERRHG